MDALKQKGSMPIQYAQRVACSTCGVYYAQPGERICTECHELAQEPPTDDDFVGMLRTSAAI